MEKLRFLFVTANDNETEAILEDKNFFKYKDGCRSHDPTDINFYNIGMFGEYEVIHFALLTEGSNNSDAALASILTAINNYHPDAVILVGIAFGKDNHDTEEPRQHIGDILVSNKVVDYESGKVINGEMHPDGPIAEAGRHLLSVFKHYGNKWSKNNENRCIFGSILSGDKVVDDRDFKNKLIQQFPRTIGGEMEGRGAYAACRHKNINEWLVVKAICDWADGTKHLNKKENQIFAAKSAVSLLKYIFSDPKAFDQLSFLKKKQAMR